MNKQHFTRFAGALIVGLSGPALGQLPAEPTVVRVEGLGEVTDALTRVEKKLGRLLTSGWEYRFVKRNRLNSNLENIERIIEALGREGWELVTVTVEEGYILKRRILSP